MDSSEESDELQRPFKKIKLARSNSSESVKGVYEEISSPPSTITSTCSSLTDNDLADIEASEQLEETQQDGGPSVSRKRKTEEDDYSCKRTKSDSVTSSQSNIPESEEITEPSSTELVWIGEDILSSEEESHTPNGTTINDNPCAMNGI